MSNLLVQNRYLIARRITQVAVILLFVIGYHWDWKIMGVEILQGNLSTSLFLDFIPMSDPFAALQIWVSGQSLTGDILLGAFLVVGFYFLVGGRAFCSWVCPMNFVTDAAHWLRDSLGVSSAIYLDRRLKYGVLLLALLLSTLSGVAAFEWVSPISMLHRELVFGMKMGWIAVVAVFVFDLLLVENGWCRHLCPLGAMYAVIGKYSPLRIQFDKNTCTKCGMCHRICPEPQVLNLKRIWEEEMVLSGECTNCGRCITQCPENSFRFSLSRWVPDSSASQRR